MQESSEWRQVFSAIGLLTQLGLTVVLSALLGGGFGWGLARLTGLGAPVMIAGILLGVAGGGLAVFRMAMQQVRATFPTRRGSGLPGPNSRRQENGDPAGTRSP